MLRHKPLAKSRRATALACVIAALGASPAAAQFIDLNLNDPGAGACVPGQNNSDSFDTTAGINEQILALTDPAGQNVFWELAFTAGAPSTVSCTATTLPGGSFVTALSCDNGIKVALPAGATDLASVSSAQPVTITAPTTSTLGTAQISLTATIDGGTFDTCQNFYTATLVEPKEAFDMVFVLDKSGSMTTAASGGSRWDALTTGVQTFLPFIETAASPPTPAGSRVGITLFDTSVNAASTAMFDILSGGAASTDFSNIPTTLNLAPGGWTAMGQGLADGIAKANDATRPRVIVLFSDGEQNRDPEITEDGCNFVNPASLINPPDCPATSGHKIVTIGIGSPSLTYLSTLENLGGNNRGASLITDNGSTFTGIDAVPGDIGATFQNAIGTALESNSPQQVANFSGLVQIDPQVPAPNVLDPFHVNTGAEAVMLSFAFSQRFETPQLVQLLAGMQITRDGTNVTSEFVPRIYGNFSGVITLVNQSTSAASGQRRDLAGEYQVTLALPSPDFKPSLEFRLYAYVEERRLKITSAPDASVQRVNDPVNISLQLDWLNQPIEDADVVVRAFVPGADMGETLSAGDPVDTSDGDDAGNPGVQKYDQLAASDPNFLDQLRLSPNAVTMTHQGGGQYTGSFTLPDTVGAVHFVYDVAAQNDALHGRIQRHWYESVYARYDTVDLANSALTATIGDTGLVLDATFRRGGGQLIGTGMGNSIRFTGVDNVTTTDLQNGSYRFLLTDVTDPDTPIEVTLGGDTIYSGPAGWGEYTGHGWVRTLMSPPHIYWLILALVLLILLLVIRRARSS